MIATATHDTKLGEDVRARINALSEMPDEWGREVSKLMRINRAHRSLVDGEPAPDRVDEYRFYQALIGVWPPDLPPGTTEAPAELIQRLTEYMIKAVKEAKVHTSWLTPNEPYEQALRNYVHRALSGPSGARLVATLQPFQQRIAALGMINSLSQTALKIGGPGIPDFYQGTELWELSLVDPDNRRPVDFAVRARLLDDVDALLTTEGDERKSGIAEYLRTWQDGRIKLLVTAAGLRLRRDLPRVFLGGSYRPVPAEVSVPAGVVSFARISDGEAVLFAAPRLCARLVNGERPLPLGGDAWKTSRLMLPPELRERVFHNVITGAEVKPTKAGDNAFIFLGETFDTLPVAILTAR
jgi:(1->4)-alpha-D-glucan 1-alpha-D-glucosylmutase